MQEESAKGESLVQKKEIEFKKVSIICGVRPSYATSEYNENRICLPISISLANLELVSHN